MQVANNIPATKLYKSTVYIQNKIWLSENLRTKGEEYAKWESKKVVVVVRMGNLAGKMTRMRT